MKCNVQYEQKKYKGHLRIKLSTRARNKHPKKEIYQHIQNYLRAPDNTSLDIMFERALENIKRKNNGG